MKKKRKYIIIILSILIITIIIFILFKHKKSSLINNIIKNDNYEISSISCDGTTTVLDKKVLKDIKNQLKELNNNGPFLGDLNVCYPKIIVTYDSDLLDIEIINKSALIIKESKTDDYYTYYVKADTLIQYLNKYFKNY